MVTQDHAEYLPLARGKPAIIYKSMRNTHTQCSMETMKVECPHCGAVYETHAVGDVEACEECGETFGRFTNEYMGD